MPLVLHTWIIPVGAALLHMKRLQKEHVPKQCSPHLLWTLAMEPGFTLNENLIPSVRKHNCTCHSQQVNIRPILEDSAASDTTSQHKFNEKRHHPELNHNLLMEIRLNQKVLKVICVSLVNIFLTISDQF